MPCKKCGKMLKLTHFTENKKEVIYHWLCSCGYRTTTIEKK